MKTRFKFAVGAAVVAVVLFGSVVAQTNRGTFTDSRDGKIYRMVTIGNQTWMAENLNYRDASWARNDVTERVLRRDKGSWCYGNDSSNCETYGRLYTWSAAMEACPAGWRLPSDGDWQTLVDFGGGSSTAGRRLKSQSGWHGNGNGTDESGFSALPGGYRDTDGSFRDVGYWGFWWTTTEGGADGARRRVMLYNYEYVSSSLDSKSAGFSVRCVRD